MEKFPAPSAKQESVESLPNPNQIFEWGIMPSNTDVLTTQDNVYRQVTKEAVEDLKSSGIVRNAASAGVGTARKYGDRVYWTRGKEGAYHNVQPDHVVLETSFEIANARTVTADDLIAIHARNESGAVENILTKQDAAKETLQTEETASEDAQNLADVRQRLGLPEK